MLDEASDLDFGISPVEGVFFNEATLYISQCLLSEFDLAGWKQIDDHYLKTMLSRGENRFRYNDFHANF